MTMSAPALRRSSQRCCQSVSGGVVGLPARLAKTVVGDGKKASAMTRVGVLVLVWCWLAMVRAWARSCWCPLWTPS